MIVKKSGNSRGITILADVRNLWFWESIYESKTTLKRLESQNILIFCIYLRPK